MFLLVGFFLVGCNSNVNTDAGDDQSEGNGDSASTGDYPSQSIQTIVPYSAGGGTDTFARIAAKSMEDVLGQSFVIVNKPGASAEIGTTELASAKPDGYNLAFISVLDYILLPNLKETTYSFDEIKYISSFTESGTVLVGGKDNKFASLDELVKYAKEHPGELSVSISGQGHTYVLMQLEKEAGIDLTPVMYSGGGESLNAVIGGHVDVAIISQSFVQQTEDQGLKTLAVTTAERVESLSHVPTFQEQGYNVESADSRILIAPKDTPDEIVEKLVTELDTLKDNQDLAEKVREAGFEFKYRSGDELNQFVEKAITKVAEVVEGNEEAFLE